MFLQLAQTDFAFRHSSHLFIAKQFEASLVTMCLTLRWPFKQFWQVCTVLILSSMQENISSPVTDLGRKWTATGIAAPLSSKVAIVTSALVIRLVFIFSGSGRGCFFTNFSSTLLVFDMSRILGLASEPCRHLLKLLGWCKPSRYQQLHVDLLLDVDTGNGVTVNGA